MIAIRPATARDAAALDVMVRELAAIENSLEHVAATAETWTTLLSLPEVAVLVAEDDGEPVGFASTVRRLHLWSGREILGLDDLYVRDGHRDRGIGSQLMAAVARLADRENLLVTWGARLDNRNAHRFYEHLGAILNTKVVASWEPPAYRRHLQEVAYV